MEVVKEKIGSRKEFCVFHTRGRRRFPGTFLSRVDACSQPIAFFKAVQSVTAA